MKHKHQPLIHPSDGSLKQEDQCPQWKCPQAALTTVSSTFLSCSSARMMTDWMAKASRTPFTLRTGPGQPGSHGDGCPAVPAAAAAGAAHPAEGVPCRRCSHPRRQRQRDLPFSSRKQGPVLLPPCSILLILLAGLRRGRSGSCPSAFLPSHPRSPPWLERHRCTPC